MSMPLGRYSRISPLVVSLPGRSHGEFGERSTPAGPWRRGVGQGGGHLGSLIPRQPAAHQRRRVVHQRLGESCTGVDQDIDQCVGFLPRPGSAGGFRTNDADLPAGDRYQPWDAARVREWSSRIGPAAQIVINRIFETVPIDEQGLDAALAVLRLSRRFSVERLEAACQFVLAGRVRSPRYAHLQPILATGQDKLVAFHPPGDAVDEGGYVRGADYYAGGAK